MDVSEEQKFAVHEFGRYARLETLEDVEFSKVRLGFVQVIEILPAPAKGLALGVLDAPRIHATLRENVLVFGGEIFADHGDESHFGEVTGRERKICS